MSSTNPNHQIGQNVDRVDQLSSPILLGLAVVSGAVATLLIELLNKV
ncbi:hypothetical protein AFFFEF_00453 [Methylorubrum extorquens]